MKILRLVLYKINLALFLLLHAFDKVQEVLNSKTAYNISVFMCRIRLVPTYLEYIV